MDLFTRRLLKELGFDTEEFNALSKVDLSQEELLALAASKLTNLNLPILSVDDSNARLALTGLRVGRRVKEELTPGVVWYYEGGGESDPSNWTPYLLKSEGGLPRFTATLTATQPTTGSLTFDSLESFPASASGWWRDDGIGNQVWTPQETGSYTLSGLIYFGSSEPIQSAQVRIARGDSQFPLTAELIAGEAQGTGVGLAVPFQRRVEALNQGEFFRIVYSVNASSECYVEPTMTYWQGVKV